MSERGVDTPMRVLVVGGKLTIEIGVATLAFSCLRAPFLWDETGTPPHERYEITDEIGFANEVRCALLHEKEDGSTPLDRLLDACCESAINDGSQCFARKDRP